MRNINRFSFHLALLVAEIPYLGDVVAGYCIGFAWLVLSVALMGWAIKKGLDGNPALFKLIFYKKPK